MIISNRVLDEEKGNYVFQHCGRRIVVPVLKDCLLDVFTAAIEIVQA